MQQESVFSLSKTPHHCVIQSTELMQTYFASASILQMHERLTLFCRLSPRRGITECQGNADRSSLTGHGAKQKSCDREVLGPAASTALMHCKLASSIWPFRTCSTKWLNSKLQSAPMKSRPVCKPLAESRQSLWSEKLQYKRS